METETMETDTLSVGYDTTDSPCLFAEMSVVNLYLFACACIPLEFVFAFQIWVRMCRCTCIITRMHSSRMRTARSLPYGGSLLGGGAWPGGSLSRGVSVWGVPGQGGSLSRGVSVQGGVQPGGSLSGGVPSQGGLHPGSLCLGGLCPGGSLCLGGLCPGGSLCLGGLCPGGLPDKRPPSSLSLWTESQMPEKTLPCHNFVAGSKYGFYLHMDTVWKKLCVMVKD